MTVREMVAALLQGIGLFVVSAAVGLGVLGLAWYLSQHVRWVP